MRKNEGVWNKTSVMKIKDTLKSTNAHMNRERFALKWLDRTSNAHTDLCYCAHMDNNLVASKAPFRKQAHTWTTTWPLVQGTIQKPACCLCFFFLQVLKYIIIRTRVQSFGSSYPKDKLVALKLRQENLHRRS